MTPERKLEIRELAWKHNEAAVRQEKLEKEDPGAKKYYTNVQIMVTISSAIGLYLEPEEIRSLSQDEFDFLCWETGNSPRELYNEGSLDLKHGAEIEFSDCQVEEE